MNSLFIYHCRWAPQYHKTCVKVCKGAPRAFPLKKRKCSLGVVLPSLTHVKIRSSNLLSVLCWQKHCFSPLRSVLQCCVIWHPRLLPFLFYSYPLFLLSITSSNFTNVIFESRTWFRYVHLSSAFSHLFS